MATDKFRALALEVDDLPDDSLVKVLLGNVSVDLGDTTRSIMAKVATAPSVQPVEQVEVTLLLYRKGTLDVRAEILEALAGLEITVTGTGFANADVAWATNWPLDSPLGRTKVSLGTTDAQGKLKIDSSSPYWGQTGRIVVTGGTFQRYGTVTGQLAAGAITIPLDFQREIPVCVSGLSMDINAGTARVFIPDMLANPPGTINMWAGLQRDGAGSMADAGQWNGSSFTGAQGMLLTCPDVGTTFVNVWFWNDAWAGDFCMADLTVTDNGGFCGG